MMRDNESDSGGSWQGPYDDISPWAARDPGGADQAPADAPDLPPESGRPDTIAFGALADEADGPGLGSYEQRGYSGLWYGSDRGEPGYGSYAGPGGRYGAGDGGSGTYGAGDSGSAIGGYGAGDGGSGTYGAGDSGSAIGGYGAGGGGSAIGGYGSGEGGYGSRGSYGAAGSYGSEGLYGAGGSYGSGDGGFGSGGWDPEPRRRRGHWLVYLTVAALAAGIGAGLTVAFDGQ